MYSLRKLEDRDIPMVKVWLQQAYIAKWFGEVDEWMNEMQGRFGEYSFIHHFIAERDGAPIGFCQYYNWGSLPPDDETGPPEPAGTYGIDYLLGEETLLGKGIGKRLVKLISDKVVEENANVYQLVADPTVEEHKTNTASIKVLEANGFRYDETGKLYKKVL